MRFEKWANTLPGVERHDEIKYRNYHQPWAQYIVKIPTFLEVHVPPEDLPEMETWCKDNLTGEYDIDFYGYFELEEDSILFGLRWA